MTTVKARDYYPITGRSSTRGTFDRIPVEELKADHPYQWTLQYWDWADPKVEKEGLPSLFYDDQLTVTATGDKTVTVPNPLSFFNFPYIPEDFKDTTRLRPDGGIVTAHSSVWPKTYRHAADSATPGGSNIADLQTLVKSVISENRSSPWYSQRSQGTGGRYQDESRDIVLVPGRRRPCDNVTGHFSYDQFSNTRNESRQEHDHTAVGSLEGVHNSIHAAFGNPDYAGFDPFFYFHHSNVDKIISLWEWCYTDYWMNNGYTVEGVDYSWNQQYGTYAQAYNEKLEEDGEFGRLIPWRHPDGTYWTNKETRFLTPDAFPKYYSYKEFLDIKVDKPAANSPQQQEARARIAKFYSVDPQTSARKYSSLAHVPVPGVGEVHLPFRFRSIKGFRLFTILARLLEHAFGRSYNFQVFYKGNNLIGNITVFAKEDDSPCKACALRRDRASLVRGVIYIPPHIVHEIILESLRENHSIKFENPMQITTDLVTKALSGKLLDLSGRVLASAQGGKVAAVPASHAAPKRLQPVEVTLLSSAIAEHEDDKNQPVHFFDRNAHEDLFPSGWKAESAEATSTH
ncbi:hypothetical protein BDN67DRAFT_980059 [Paxillus ammoniavirescens]|nr:hypothetical protein BDN67DRAFT_980059 [Paxillus ammoniavirescens]